ncbi:MAG TPA: branched-chain amino acid ABC transporter ATP-binding protein/permease [Xanthobacteraceae bacterium]|jgi:ABC-type branched-subunit amino acid transport system ATPase component/ABC-type branched-subunit amino acid transport system permease subunit
MKLAGAVAAVALIAGVCGFIARANGYELYVIVLVGLTTIVGVGLNVLLGMSGQISLGHAAFYAIGAYVVGILTTALDWTVWTALPLAGLIAGAAGLVLAVPALRVRGPYLAMVTIAFGFVVEQGAAEWSGLTGGWNGLLGIPMPSVAGSAFSEREMAFFVLACTIASLTLYARLSASAWGKAMRAVRDSEVASQAIGLDPTVIRAAAFALSAFAAGFAGGMFASMTSFISPESFPFSQSILFLLVVMIGGADRLVGPLVGALVVVLLPELLSFLAQYRLLFVGLLLLLVLRLAPGGLVGLAAQSLPRPRLGKPAAASTQRVLAYLSPQREQSGLSVTGLSVHFGGVRAVHDLSFAAHPSEITSIIGPNGAGKSTVLNLICGFYRPDRGSIRLGDREITRMACHAIARAGIARTYQTTKLFTDMSVLDNILIALRRGHLGGGSLFSPGRESTRRELAEGILAFVGYGGALDQPAGALAHVDRRLVEIARALAMQPTVLALDEPAAGLSAADTARIGDLLGKLARAGIAVILVEHEMNLVMGISDRVIVLDAGTKISEGTPAQIAADPRVLKAYLGETTAADRARRRALGPGAEIVLATERLSSGYGAADVIRDVDIAVETGELVAVLGANGAGKTTLMRALSGLNRPVKGAVLFLGEHIESYDASRIAGYGLVLVPEGRQVFPELSVIDNLRLGAYARPSQDLEQLLERLLDRFPQLRERSGQRAGLLSGGEQQMLAIARGLIARPRLLLLDEPSLGLAPTLLDRLYDLLAELRDEGTTILLVDQAADLALSVADRCYLIASGGVKQAGSAAEMRADPALARAYLGERERAI